MARGRDNTTQTLSAAREALSARLQERRVDLEETVLARINSLSVPRDQGSPEYVVGLRSAVSAALDCSHEVLAHGQQSVPIPPALLVQARLAASHDIRLDTVLQRYYYGHTLVSDFCLSESAQIGGIGTREVHRILKDLGAFFERLISAVSAEHALQETRIKQESTGSGITACVRGLLAGKPVDFEHINYELDTWHLGVVTFGAAVGNRLRDVAAGLDRRVLVVPGDHGQTWAWFGGRKRLQPADFEQEAHRQLPPRATLTIGEPARGESGWRLSHKQALATVPIARNLERPAVVHYADFALLSSMLQDDLLIHSLSQIYIAPLDGDREDGGVLRQTLHAFVAANGQISSTAAALRVSRKTVSNRLAAAEERIGKPLLSCAPDLAAALLLDRASTTRGSN